MDALRLLAAAAVMLFHFTARDHVRWGQDVLPSEVFPLLSHVTRFGYAGVHLFFTISGFVILMSLWGRTVPQFIASRVSRLYPVFWAAVLLTATLRWLWPTFSDITPGQLLANLTMLHEPFGVEHVDGVYWTLWVEMQFYLLMIVFLLWGITVRRVLAVATVAPLLSTVVALAWPQTGSLATFVSWANTFGAGMVLYVIHREGATRVRWAIVVLNVAQAAVLAVTQKAHAIDIIATPGRISPWAFGVVVVLAMAAVAVVALVPAVRDLNWRFLTTLGVLTYPLYLTHEYVGWAVIEALHPALGRYPTLLAAVAVCVVLAWLLHRYVERPAHRPLRRWLENRLTRPSRGARRQESVAA